MRQILSSITRPIVSNYLTTDTSDWAGAYFGAGFGLDRTEFDWTESDGAGSFNDNLDGVGLAVFGGFNIEAGPIVVGLEGGASKHTAEGTFTGVPGPGDINANMDWQINLKGRLGYNAGRFMPFVSGGYSWARLETEWPDSGSNGVHENNTHGGPTLGAGVDVMFSDALFGRLEYTHAWYGEERYTYCPPGCNADIEISQNSVSVGLGYRF